MSRAWLLRILKNSQEFLRTLESSQGILKILENSQEFSRTLKSSREFSRTLKNSQKLSRILKNSQEFFRTLKNSQELKKYAQQYIKSAFLGKVLRKEKKASSWVSLASRGRETKNNTYNIFHVFCVRLYYTPQL